MKILIPMIKYSLIVGLLIYALMFTQRACSLGEKYYTLKADHDRLATQLVTDKIEADQKIADLEAQKAAKDAEIVKLNESVAVKNSSIKDLHETTSKLEAEFATLHDKDEQIVNLQEQVNIWKQKFSLAEAVIADKDAIIFSLTAKYDAQLKIATEWHGLYEQEHQLRLVSEKLYKEIEGKYRGTNFIRGVQTAALAICVGFITYVVLK